MTDVCGFDGFRRQFGNNFRNLKQIEVWILALGFQPDSTFTVTQHGLFLSDIRTAEKCEGKLLTESTAEL